MVGIHRLPVFVGWLLTLWLPNTNREGMRSSMHFWEMTYTGLLIGQQLGGFSAKCRATILVDLGLLTRGS